jgi:hypothetical protein
MRKMKSAERPKKTFCRFFFLFAITPVGDSRILWKLCMSNLGVDFHILCKRLDLFLSVRGLTSKLPTYPTCQLAPLSSTQWRFATEKMYLFVQIYLKSYLGT